MAMQSQTMEKNFDFFLQNSFSSLKEDEWVAIFGNKVVSHGFDLSKVVAEAEKTAPRAKVLFSKIKKTAKYL